MSSEPIFTRLTDVEGGDADVRAAAELLRAGDPALALTPAVIESAGARLVQPRRARPRTLRLGWLAAAVTLFVVPVAMAAVVIVRPAFLSKPDVVKPPPPPARKPGKQVQPQPVAPGDATHGRIGAAHGSLDAVFMPQLPVPMPVAAPAPVVFPAVAGLPPPPPPSLVPDEASDLALALEQLRRRSDPAAALATLDESRSRHPKGAFAREAAVLRLEALLALARRSEALDVLEALAREGFEGLARAQELRVLRGELLASEGRCARAIEAFDVVLERPAAAEFEGRALFGRASCRARGGDAERSRADLEKYLARFPNGPYAGPARAALGVTE